MSLQVPLTGPAAVHHRVGRSGRRDAASPVHHRPDPADPFPSGDHGRGPAAVSRRWIVSGGHNTAIVGRCTPVSVACVRRVTEPPVLDN